MSKPFRVIDTGLRGGRENIAFDAALVEAHKAGDIPDTIRFLRFPKSALVGMHQVLSHEVRLDHCLTNGIEIARRITGGGAIYFDEGQLGWELVFHRATLGISDLGALAGRICEAAALGLNKLGLDAHYRPRNDIEIEGRKISGTGGFFDGDTLFYQGTLLIDFDPKDMITALNVPEEKLAKRELDDARARVVTMKEILGRAIPDRATIQEGLIAGFAEALEIDPAWGEITQAEESVARRQFDEEIGTDAFVYSIDAPAAGDGVSEASRTGPGGTIKTFVRLEGPNRDRIREALITGDFFVTPPRTVFDLEAALRGIAVDRAGQVIEEFFEDAEIGLLSVGPGDFRAVIEDALAKSQRPVQ